MKSFENYDNIQKQLEFIGIQLHEIRRSQNKTQSDFLDYGLSRRQIQHAEYGVNLTISSLINILDCYGWSLKDFFQDKLNG